MIKNFNRFAFSIFLLATLLGVANGQTSAKTETIRGTVVAYQTPLTCVWHPCAVWLVVKVEDKNQTRYLRIDVEYFPIVRPPVGGMPIELIENSKKWKFKASRHESRDVSLERYLNVVDMSGKNISEEVALDAWRLLSGAENEILPFGKVLPNYSVKTNKFKLLEDKKHFKKN